MKKNSNCAGQMVFEFAVHKTRQNETIKYPVDPKVYLLFDKKDASRIENFKQNFTGIKYIESKEFYAGFADYILIFLSMEGLMNEEFLKAYMDVDDNIDNGKMIGLIIDDDLRKLERRFELYEFYHNMFLKICDFKKENGSNADIRRCGDIYERCSEKIGEFLDKTLNNEKNKRICAEDIFELCLKNDGKNGLRIDHSKKVDCKNVEEGKIMETKNEYNNYNCTIVNADKSNQISFNEGSENFSVIQKNGIEEGELINMCDALVNEIHILNEEDRSEFKKLIEQIKEEFGDSQKSKENKLTKCLKLIVPMLTIANGTPTLCENIQNLQSFLMTHIT